MSTPTSAQIDVSGLSSQALAELAAALQLGMTRLDSPATLDLLGVIEQALAADAQHYLWLRDREQHGSFFGCGTARGAANTMATDGRVCYLHPLQRGECPNCFEE